MTVPYLRLAEVNDINEIDVIINEAKEFLKKQNIDQWQNGYPNEESIKADIRQRIGYVLVVNQTVAGYAALWQGIDPDYLQIDGQWNESEFNHYTALHRISLSNNFRGQHLSSFLISSLITISRERGYHDIRIDTHENNQVMQHVITNSGFIFRGIVTMHRDNTKRRAYQLTI